MITKFNSKQKDIIMIKLTILKIVIVCSIFSGWAVNFTKFDQCDFKTGEEKPYKCEIVRVAGIFPIVGMITGWMDFED